MSATIEKVTAADLVRTPEWLLLEFDLRHGKSILVRMNERLYSDSPFLDHHLRGIREAIEMDTAELYEVFFDFPNSGRCRRFIFHTGFCCSTLLSRCLDDRSQCLMLREPLVLHMLAATRSESQRKTTSISWSKLLQVAVKSLSRTFRQTQQTVVKANCNAIWKELAGGDQRSRALFLYQGLEDFLTSALKDRQRLDRFCSRLKLLKSNASSVPDGSRLAKWIRTSGHTARPVEAAAAHWIFGTLVFRHHCANDSGVRSLHCDDFLANVQTVMHAVRTHLRLGVSDAVLVALAERSTNVHAKNAKAWYDAEKRRSELTNLKSRHSREIAAGMAFADKLQHDHCSRLPGALAV